MQIVHLELYLKFTYGNVSSSHLDGLPVLLPLLPVHLQRRRRQEDDVGLEIRVVKDGERGGLHEGEGRDIAIHSICILHFPKNVIEMKVQGGATRRGLSFVDSDLVVSTIDAKVTCPVCQIPTYPSKMERAKQYLGKK